jgi:hypothetical protein
MNCYNWIKTKLSENNLEKKVVYNLYDSFLEETDSDWTLDSYKRKVRLAYEELSDKDNLDFSEEDYLKLEAQKQKLFDTNNGIRKTNREQYRLYNYLEEVYNQYVNLLKNVRLPEIKIKEQKTRKSNSVGILQLSDIHFNEIICPEESFGNSYDFSVASKRLKKFVTESMKIFDIYDIKTCYVFFNGDLINSQRRLSERLAQSTSLVRASLLATYLLEQVILELASKYKVFFSGVIGNESRIEDEMESTDILASENWDYLIYNNLRLLLDDKYKNIKYIKPENNIQTIISLENGFNALLLHGHTFKSSMTVDRTIGQLVSNYLYKGIPVHGIFYGHYHSSCIGDVVSRSSSLSGGNAYSNNDLMYLSRASQNVYIVNDDKGYNAIKIDLQNVDNIVGYDIVSELERYNVTNKLKPNVEIISKNLV